MNLRNIPNIITSLRFLLLIPIVMALLAKKYDWAFYVFVIAGISDGLDGYLARRFNWTSRVGAFVDPLADKLLMLFTFFALTYTEDIPTWLFLLVISRDVIIMAGAFIYRYLIAEPDYAPTFLSKTNTFFLIIFVLTLLADRGFFELPYFILPTMMFLVATTTTVTLIDYVVVWSRKAYQQRKVMYQ